MTLLHSKSEIFNSSVLDCIYALGNVDMCSTPISVPPLMVLLMELCLFMLLSVASVTVLGHVSRRQLKEQQLCSFAKHTYKHTHKQQKQTKNEVSILPGK